MLRKRTRSIEKDQHHMAHLTISDASRDYYFQSHSLGHKLKNNSIFIVPRLFVGLGPNSLLDSDSIRSPTSPLDFRLLSNSGNPGRTPKSSPREGHKRSWDCSKVGLSIIDSLDDSSKASGKILRSLESKNLSISPQMRIKTPNCQNYTDSFEASKSLPKDFCKLPYTQHGSTIHKGKYNVVLEIGETRREHEPFGKTWSCSLDSCNPFKTLSGLTLSNNDSDSGDFSLKDMSVQASFPHFIGGSQNSNTLHSTELNSNRVSISSSLSAGEIENSEDYTCVISHGPNPKTTHIFGDCVLETHSNDLKIRGKSEEKENEVSLLINGLQTPNQYPSGDFLSFCFHCNKKLEEGKDIYMYRGEKAFCSLNCRTQEIMIDEELEKSNPCSENSPEREIGEELFETGILTTT